MNATKQQKIREELTEMQHRLLQELRQRLGNIGNVSSHTPAELLDLISDSEADYMSAISAEAGSETVREIHEALEKLSEGTYGVCDDCGEDISERRLKARPFATLCIRCKEEEERRRYGQQQAVGYARGAAPGASLGEEEDTGYEGQFDQVMRELEDVELSEMF